MSRPPAVLASHRGAPRAARTLAPLLVIAVLMTGPARAQPEPPVVEAFPPIVVDEDPVDDLALYDVATASDGSFLVLYGISARRPLWVRAYTAAGEPRGERILVADAYPYRSELTALDDGTYLVTWKAALWDEQARRLSGDGTPVGPVFPIEGSFPWDLVPPPVAAPGGSFVVARRECIDYLPYYYTCIGSTVLGQTYDAHDQPAAPPFEIAVLRAFVVTQPVAPGPTPEAHFAVLWRDPPRDDHRSYAQQVATMGGNSGPAVLLTFPRRTTGRVLRLTSDGRYLALVTGGTADPTLLELQIHARDGATASVPIDLTGGIGGEVSGIQIGAVLDGGDLAVTWIRRGEVLNRVQEDARWVRLVSADGTPLGAPLRIVETSFLRGFSVAATASDGLVMAWARRRRDDVPSQLELQRFRVLHLFGDGFESGDTAHWSEAVAAP